MKQFKPILWFVGGFGAVCFLFALGLLFRVGSAENSVLSHIPRTSILKPMLERNQISKMLGDMRITSNLLKLESFPVQQDGKNYNIHFTLDESLQEKIENVYEKYDPVYATFVAMDPETGKILALVDYSTEAHQGNLALKAPYPAASVFKVVTSAAALDEGKIKPKSTFPVNGSYGTLYKRNLRDVVNRWTRFISIEEAFAKSVNTVFAKIAMNRVGPGALQKYANGFGFNQEIPFDMPLEMGSAIIPNDEFGLAESGSGYTKRQTLNPVQGAMIASAVINEGKVPSPYLVDYVTTSKGVRVYENEGKTLSRPMDKDTARSLSMIMENTITQGTARKEYRDYNHHPLLSKLFIGAKTGSLSGENPAGRYDWFVGFAQSSTNPRQKIAFASMIINRKYWKVKSAHIAREAIIQYFAKTNATEL